MPTQSPREIVRRCLTFETPARVPRHLWTLPWVEIHYPRELAELRRDFPDDIVIAQFEFGPGCHPATARAIFEEWEGIR